MCDFISGFSGGTVELDQDFGQILFASERTCFALCSSLLRTTICLLPRPSIVYSPPEASPSCCPSSRSKMASTASRNVETL